MIAVHKKTRERFEVVRYSRDFAEQDGIVSIIPIQRMTILNGTALKIVNRTDYIICDTDIHASLLSDPPKPKKQIDFWKTHIVK